jgi:hypothetical protein
MSMGNAEQEKRALELNDETALNAALAHIPAAVGVHAKEAYGEMKRQGSSMFKTTIDGDVLYDAPNKRILEHITEMKVSMGGIPVMDVQGDWYNLLFYTMNKNFTWGTVSGETIKCACEPLDAAENPFPVFYVPSGTGKPTEASITVMGKDVTADKYSFDLDMGVQGAGDMSITIDVYTEVGKQVTIMQQMNFTMSDGSGGMAMGLAVTYEFGSIKSIPSDSKGFLPPAGCTCKAKIPVTPSFPNSCTSGITGCQCPIEADMPFCGKLAVWPVLEGIDFVGLDSFVKTAYDMTLAAVKADGVSVSADCGAEYKEFLCQFYFPECQDGSPSFPALPKFDKCDAGFEAQASSQSGALQNYNVAAGKTNPGGPSSGGMGTGEIVGIVIGCLAAVALIAGGFVYYRKQSTAGYTKV